MRLTKAAHSFRFPCLIANVLPLLLPHASFLSTRRCNSFKEAVMILSKFLKNPRLIPFQLSILYPSNLFSPCQNYTHKIFSISPILIYFLDRYYHPFFHHSSAHHTPSLPFWRLSSSSSSHFAVLYFRLQLMPSLTQIPGKFIKTLSLIFIFVSIAYGGGV